MVVSDLVDTVSTGPLQHTSSGTKESEEGESKSVLELSCQPDACLVTSNLNRCLLPSTSFRWSGNQVIEWAAVFLILFFTDGSVDKLEIGFAYVCLNVGLRYDT